MEKLKKTKESYQILFCFCVLKRQFKPNILTHNPTDVFYTYYVSYIKYLYELAKLDWQFDMVGMYTLSKDSVRVRNKNKGKRKKNKKVDSRNRVEKSSYEHIGLSSNNSNELFLSESSDTLNNDLIGLSRQRLKTWS